MDFLLIHSCDGCMYSLAKSEEVKDAKERENAFLRDELAKIHSRYVCVCPYMSQ